MSEFVIVCAQCSVIFINIGYLRYINVLYDLALKSFPVDDILLGLFLYKYVDSAQGRIPIK